MLSPAEMLVCSDPPGLSLEVQLAALLALRNEPSLGVTLIKVWAWRDMRGPDTSWTQRKYVAPNRRSQRPTGDLLLQEVGSFAGRVPWVEPRELSPGKAAGTQQVLSTCLLHERAQPPCTSGPVSASCD